MSAISETGAEPLARLAELASAAEAPELAGEIRALAQRADAGRFYVACVGEFKRGKSTLINALLQMPVLPTGVVPVTSVPTVLRHGDVGARVRQNGGWRSIGLHAIADYVSQERNPNNVKKVTGLEVFLDHSLLRDGLCLVDTPGLGSIFSANTASTLDFLPHIDAAIVVLGADPPISGDELRFTTELARQVDTLVFVLNKADRIPAEQRGEAARFTQRVLEETLNRAVEPIYQVSALAGTPDPAIAQGWHALLAELDMLASTPGRRLARAAARRGVERLGRRLATLLEEERRALLAPLAESDRRLAALGELAASALRAQHELEPLLAQEERDLHAMFERRRIQFLDRMLPVAHSELAERFDPRLGRAAALKLANDIVRSRLTDWLRASEDEAEAAYTRAVVKFRTRAREILERMAETAGTSMEAMPMDEAFSSGLQVARGFYFTDLLSQHESPLPWAGLLDVLTPGVVARPRRLVAAQRYLEHLLTANATRVESDLRERVHKSGRRLRDALDRALKVAAQSAQHAVAKGRAARAAGDTAVQAEVARLDRWLAELRAMIRLPDPAKSGEVH